MMSSLYVEVTLKLSESGEWLMVKARREVTGPTRRPTTQGYLYTSHSKTLP